MEQSGIVGDNMLKKDYNKFLKDIRNLLRRYDKQTKEEEFAVDTTFYVATPYGKLRVYVAKFENRQKTQLVMTQIENVDYLPDRIRRREHFNKWNGKYMEINRSFNKIVWWLEDYLHELFRVVKNTEQIDEVGFVNMMRVCNNMALENRLCFDCIYHKKEMCPGNPERIHKCYSVKDTMPQRTSVAAT